MDVKPASFDKYVVRDVLANNKYGITQIESLESLKSLFFVKEEYPHIEELIKTGNIEAITNLPQVPLQTGEYLDVILFKDQHQKRYIVTVYDSNALEQDPQVIEIYPLK